MCVCVRAAPASGGGGVMSNEQLWRMIEEDEWYCSEGESDGEEEGGEREAPSQHEWQVSPSVKCSAVYRQLLLHAALCTSWGSEL